MLGKIIMVAPVVEKGDRRKIIFPKGSWQSEEGEIYKGPSVQYVNAGLDEVPVFKKL
jgi:alpha-glucosidase (family GH31 glycosyl hydrolase)